MSGFTPLHLLCTYSEYAGGSVTCSLACLHATLASACVLPLKSGHPWTEAGEPSLDPWPLSIGLLYVGDDTAEETFSRFAPNNRWYAICGLPLANQPIYRILLAANPGGRLTARAVPLSTICTDGRKIDITYRRKRYSSCHLRQSRRDQDRQKSK